MIMRASATLGRRPSGGRGKSLKTYSRGRVCGVRDCETVLSAYNPSSFCALHDRTVRPTRCAARSISELACEHCGAGFETANPHRRYCSDRCRMAAFARRKRAAPKQGGADDHRPGGDERGPAHTEQVVLRAARLEGRHQ